MSGIVNYIRIAELSGVLEFLSGRIRRVVIGCKKFIIEGQIEERAKRL